MLSQTTYARIYRLSAWYDLLVTWPYATPLTLAALWSAMGHFHGVMGWPALPDLPVLGVLFGNFFGTVVLIWSLVRLRLNDPALARYDACARWLFSIWMIYALSQGASPVIWLFLLIELGFAVLQSLPLRRN